MTRFAIGLQYIALVRPGVLCPTWVSSLQPIQMDARALVFHWFSIGFPLVFHWFSIGFPLIHRDLDTQYAKSPRLLQCSHKRGPLTMLEHLLVGPSLPS